MNHNSLCLLYKFNSKSHCNGCDPLSLYGGETKNLSFLVLRPENYRFYIVLIIFSLIRGGRGLDPAGGGAWILCRGEGPAGGGAWKLIRGEGPAGGGAWIFSRGKAPPGEGPEK